MEYEHTKSTVEFGFDSFEFEDDFLTRLDLDLKKNNVSEKTFVSKGKPSDMKREKEEKMLEIKAQCDDSIIEDSYDSDFFDFHSKKNKPSLKVVNKHDKNRSNELCTSGFISCLSPILGGKASRSINKTMNLSSSTPERSNNGSKIKPKAESIKNSDFDYLKADLFDDWNMNDDKKDDKQRESITLSQALKLLEEAESERQSVKESLNDSIDLLTGKVIDSCVGMLFDESFDLPKSTKKKDGDKESSEECLIIGSFKTACKPQAAQKLNFEPDKMNHKKTDKENNKNYGFSSDDDFDFCTQDLLKKVKQVAKRKDLNTGALNLTESDSELKDSDLNESSDCIITFNKRRRCHKINESDTAEDSPKILRQNISRKRRNSGLNIGREFIDLEAEASDSVEVSSDEAEQDGQYDESFVDEASYFTQNCAANMTAKYLESVKTVTRLDTFKIPAKKQYNDVFSQNPEESNSDYEIDSFCVKYVDEEKEENKTDLSDLEIAEKILEMDRKKRKKKRGQKLRKLNPV